MDPLLAKLKRQLKDIDATISELERLEAALASPKSKPVAKARPGILFQMIRKQA
jgi:hypothetical protein